MKKFLNFFKLTLFIFVKLKTKIYPCNMENKTNILSSFSYQRPQLHAPLFWYHDREVIDLALFKG